MIQVLILSALAAVPSTQGAAPGKAAAEDSGDVRVLVTRQDLAEAVQDIDAAFTEGKLLPASEERTALAETNLAFDRITKTFFSLNLVAALGELAQMRTELLGPEAVPFPSVVMESKVDGVWVRHAARWQGQPEWEVRPRTRINLDVPAVEPVNERPLIIAGAPLRASILERLEGLGEKGPDGAARALRQRLKLRWDAASQVKTAEFLTGPAAFEASLVREMEALEREENPYALLRGDHWRTFPHGRRNLAARVFCPNSSPESGMPLVVAFHGAGGDENFLFEIAGQGRIKTLAEQHGALVVAPFTIDFLSSKKAFESLLAGIKSAYDYDEERVFVVGHSMGAMAVSRLCGELPERLTAAACIAGFAKQDFDAALPIHVLSGDLDLIVPFEGVKASAESAANAGAQVRFTAMKDQGHTLLLPAALERVFEDWFGSK